MKKDENDFEMVARGESPLVPRNSLHKIVSASFSTTKIDQHKSSKPHKLPNVN